MNVNMDVTGATQPDGAVLFTGRARDDATAVVAVLLVVDA